MEDKDLDREIRILSDRINEGKCILFTGAGINTECTNSRGEKAPVGAGLATAIAKRFFPGEALSPDLPMVSAYVDTQYSRPELNRFIYDYFSDFHADTTLESIAKYRWRRIFTTNYDLLLEEAYQKSGAPSKLTPICTSYDVPVEAPGQKIPYYKLHGCISRINSPQPPLVLTPKDYAGTEIERKTLILRLNEDIFFSTFLFAGYSLRDPDFQRLFFQVQRELGEQNFPRSFALMPDADLMTCKVWDQHKITVLRLTATQFFEKIGRLPPPPSSGGGPTAPTPPIAPSGLGTRTALDLASAFDVVDKHLGTGSPNYESFFKGNVPDWDIIRNDADAQRDMYEDVMDQVLLVDEPARARKADLAIITAEAGAGKSTLLMRLAFDLAVSFEQTVLFYRRGRKILVDALEELYRTQRKRIFVFFDDAADNVDKIRFLMDRAKALDLPITVLAAERKNEWNEIRVRLGQHVPAEFELSQLSNSEIENIIKVLEKTQCLKAIRNLSHADRVALFKDKAQKHLLVALREITEGKDFDHIVQDEFEGIPSETGKKTYLWVCALHQLGVPVRAGLISRLAHVSFAEFKEKLFKPCELVLIAEKDEREEIYLYRSRHPVIASIVFRFAQNRGEDTTSIFNQILSNMDLGYSSDREAFSEMIRLRQITDDMPTIEHRRNFFNLALLKSGGEGFVYQHFGLMEMRYEFFDEAEDKLQQACAKEPTNPSFTHSIASLLFRRYKKATNDLQRERLFKRAKELLTSLIRVTPTNDYPYTTLAKLLLEGAKIAKTEMERASLLAEAHKVVSDGLRCCTKKIAIRGVEAEVLQALGHDSKALAALKAANIEDKTNARIALFYARILEENGDLDKAIEAVIEALKYNAMDRSLNQRAGILTFKKTKEAARAIPFLRRAFDPIYNDTFTNLYLAGCEVLAGNYRDSDGIFAGFKKNQSRLDREERSMVLALDVTQYKGKVEHLLGLNRGFITPDTMPRSVYFDGRSGCKNVLEVGTRVHFQIQFSILGPVARELGV